MKLLFQQPEQDRYHGAVGLEEFGIAQCLLKRIVAKHDKSNITRKRHYHKYVEVHIVDKGYQIYEIAGERVHLEKGSFLMLCAMTSHRMIEEAEETEKYSFTFELKSNGIAQQRLSDAGAYFLGELPPAVWEGIAYIEKEKRECRPYYTVLICNRVLDCILQMLRLLPSAVAETAEEQFGDVRMKLAKQYVEENICYAVSVDQIAQHCHIGKKQLTRIFLREQGCTAAEYVRRERCRRIEKLLADPSQTLSGVSEAMHFCNEYYFNTFFKRYSGMTPGAYRRFILGTQ